MKTGRPAKANTIYKVSIHNNCGRKYASTQPFTVDENGKKHYSHKHWGIVDDNMKFHPNSTYFYTSLEERSKLIFPSDWDLSEIEALSGTGHRGVIEYNGGDLDRMYGPTWFLDNIALIFNKLWRRKRGQPLMRISPLCGRRDSNPYALRHQILSLAWLPITTRPLRFRLQIYYIFINTQISSSVGILLHSTYLWCVPPP